jgi:subfamily B ATP-binding cassette protein HlyB/CyaB
MSPLREAGRHEFLWLLGSLSGFYRLPFDATLIAQQFPPPYTIATLHEAARSLGLKTGEVSIAELNWQKLPLPAIAFLRPVPMPLAANDEHPTAGNHLIVAGALDAPNIPDTPAPPPSLPVLILKSDARKETLLGGGQKLLYFRAGSSTPEYIDITEAAQHFEPDLILVAREASTAPTPGEAEQIPGFVAEKKEFGFKWFLPELLKHKTIWRDVLLASLAIQLVGLATPLFTQVVIDKVVIHQSNSTLIVLGVALFMFMLFTSGMTWLRQYLVLHTGNRIDAVLGSQVFRHLLRLPLPYFEQRPTGTLVARRTA